MNDRARVIATVAGIATIVLLVVGIIILIVNLQTNDYPEVTIEVSPSKATVTANGRTISAGKQKLAPGKTVISASREGYKTQQQTITLTKNQTRTVTFILKAESEAAQKEQGSDEEQLILEGISSQKAEELGNLTAEKNPLIAFLPYLGEGLDFRVDYGLPADKKRADAGYVAIQITAPTPAARQEALKWMRSVGEDPSDYEIVFIDYQGPIKDSGGIFYE